MSMRDYEKCVHCEHDLSKAEQCNGLCDACRDKGYKPRSYYEEAECHETTCAILSVLLAFCWAGHSLYMGDIKPSSHLNIGINIALLLLTLSMVVSYMHFELIAPHTEEADRNKVVTPVV